jgi:hypothetical protein
MKYVKGLMEKSNYIIEMNDSGDTRDERDN